jgi:hypothetical protein
MTLEPLKVDAELLGAAGQRLLTAAQGLPDAPEAFTPAYGSDALSQALSVDVPKAEAPIIEGLPPLKQNAIGTAESVVEAARRYASADSQLKSKIDQQMGGGPSGGSSGGGGGAPSAAGGGSAAPATGSGVGAAGAPGAAAAGVAGGGDGGMGAMGGLMGMPMQMAQQAGQIPQQIGGMAGSLPQSAMQGAQQVGDQVKQIVEQFSGKDSEEKGQAPEAGGKHRAEEPPADAAGAAPGQAEGERAPAAPTVPSPKPADPTINL